MNDVPALEHLDVPVGQKIAAGRDADVFEVGEPSERRVLRRYRNGRSSEREAEIMRQAAAHGYPVPAVYDVRGIDMVMERVAGPTMLQELGQRPWTVVKHARTLAQLHRRLVRIPPLEWMQRYPPAATEPTVLALDGQGTTPSSDVLLHLDLHPDNVILSPDGPVVIDWSSAKRGEVSAAVALTWVIMATSEVADLGVKRAVVLLLRRLLVSEFLRHSDRAGALRQLQAVAQVRINDRNVRASEQEAIRGLLRRHGLAS
jgi:aminoglycoside phosphotransferase (APT) family kinase protein